MGEIHNSRSARTEVSHEVEHINEPVEFHAEGAHQEVDRHERDLGRAALNGYAGVPGEAARSSDRDLGRTALDGYAEMPAERAESTHRSDQGEMWDRTDDNETHGTVELRNWGR